MNTRTGKRVKVPRIVRMHSDQMEASVPQTTRKSTVSQLSYLQGALSWLIQWVFSFSVVYQKHFERINLKLSRKVLISHFCQSLDIFN